MIIVLTHSYKGTKDTKGFYCNGLEKVSLSITVTDGVLHLHRLVVGSSFSTEKDQTNAYSKREDDKIM